MPIPIGPNVASIRIDGEFFPRRYRALPARIIALANASSASTLAFSLVGMSSAAIRRPSDRLACSATRHIGESGAVRFVVKPWLIYAQGIGTELGSPRFF